MIALAPGNTNCDTVAKRSRRVVLAEQLRAAKAEANHEHTNGSKARETTSGRVSGTRQRYALQNRLKAAKSKAEANQEHSNGSKARETTSGRVNGTRQRQVLQNRLKAVKAEARHEHTNGSKAKETVSDLRHKTKGKRVAEIMCRDGQTGLGQAKTKVPRPTATRNRRDDDGERKSKPKPQTLVTTEADVIRELEEEKRLTEERDAEIKPIWLARRDCHSEAGWYEDDPEAGLLKFGVGFKYALMESDEFYDWFDSLKFKPRLSHQGMTRVMTDQELEERLREEEEFFRKQKEWIVNEHDAMPAVARHKYYRHHKQGEPLLTAEEVRDLRPELDHPTQDMPGTFKPEVDRLEKELNKLRERGFRKELEKFVIRQRWERNSLQRLGDYDYHTTWLRDMHKDFVATYCPHRSDGTFRPIRDSWGPCSSFDLEDIDREGWLKKTGCDDVWEFDSQLADEAIREQEAVGILIAEHRMEVIRWNKLYRALIAKQRWDVDAEETVDEIIAFNTVTPVPSDNEIDEQWADEQFELKKEYERAESWWLEPMRRWEEYDVPPTAVGRALHAAALPVCAAGTAIGFVGHLFHKFFGSGEPELWPGRKHKGGSGGGGDSNFDEMAVRWSAGKFGELEKKWLENDMRFRERVWDATAELKSVNDIAGGMSRYEFLSGNWGEDRGLPESFFWRMRMSSGMERARRCGRAVLAKLVTAKR